MTELDMSRGLEYSGKIPDGSNLQKIVEKILSEL
jgi:hypothetical protein